jgi:protein TonB
MVVDENGNVISANAISGDPLLRESAEQAAGKAKFSGLRPSGKPVKITGTLIYNFTLRMTSKSKTCHSTC